MTLVHIVVAALAGGVLATLVAAATLRLHAHWIPGFVSFAVGALLGAVFLELLPHALEHGTPTSVMLSCRAACSGTPARNAFSRSVFCAPQPAAPSASIPIPRYRTDFVFI